MIFKPLLLLAASLLVIPVRGGTGPVCADIDLTFFQPMVIGGACNPDPDPDEIDITAVFTQLNTILNLPLVGGLPVQDTQVHLVLTPTGTCFPEGNMLVTVDGATIKLVSAAAGTGANNFCLNVYALAIAAGATKAEICTGHCGKSGLFRRLEDGATILQEDDDMYRDMTNKCADHEYDVALHVDSHMMAIASPKQDAIAAGCPLVATHSKYDHKTHKHEKEVLVWEKDDIDPHTFENSYSIGTFKGSELAKAHESVYLPYNQEAYDIINNNCANYMLALAKALDVKVDSKLATFVTSRLLLNKSQTFMDRIYNSANFKSLFNGRGLRSSAEVQDEELINLLVEKHIHA